MDDCVVTARQEQGVILCKDELRACLIMSLPRKQQVPTPRLQSSSQLVRKDKVLGFGTSQRKILPDSEPPTAHFPDGLRANVRTLSGRIIFEQGVSRPHEKMLTTPLSGLQARKCECEGVGARPLGPEGEVRKVCTRVAVCTSWTRAGESGSEDAVRTTS